MSDTAGLNIANIQVYAEDQAEIDKSNGTFDTNIASDPHYYLWQSEFQTVPMGVGDDPSAYVEVMLSGRWYLFDPSGVSPPMGLVRLGTGRDAADAAFATVFGNVRSAPPAIQIEAITGGDSQLVMPAFCDDLLSTIGLEPETIR